MPIDEFIKEFDKPALAIDLEENRIKQIFIQAVSKDLFRHLVTMDHSVSYQKVKDMRDAELPEHQLLTWNERSKCCYRRKRFNCHRPQSLSSSNHFVDR